MSTQNYKWIQQYLLSKNKRIICSICGAIYVLAFSKSAKFHIVKWHKKDYKKTEKNYWEFYDIRNNTVKCKFCDYYEPIDREKLLQHLIRKHKINNSKDDLIT